MMRPVLYIFVKAPLMGKAKTRLARDIGYVHAQRLYKAMTANLLRNVQDPRWETVLAITPARFHYKLPLWDGLPQEVQAQGSLSPRLAHAFNRKGPVVVIGSDCPQVTRTDIANAFEALGRGQGVLGPADDGGFWLIGMNGPAPVDMFDHVRWSHDETLSDMKTRFDGPVHELRTLIDVDDLSALKAVRKGRGRGW